MLKSPDTEFFFLCNIIIFSFEKGQANLIGYYMCQLIHKGNVIYDLEHTGSSNGISKILEKTPTDDLLNQVSVIQRGKVTDT